MILAKALVSKRKAEHTNGYLLILPATLALTADGWKKTYFLIRM